MYRISQEYHIIWNIIWEYNKKNYPPKLGELDNPPNFKIQETSSHRFPKVWKHILASSWKINGNTHIFPTLGFGKIFLMIADFCKVNFCVSKLFRQFNIDSCCVNKTGGVHVHLFMCVCVCVYVCVSVYWSLCVLCEFVYVCDIKSEYQKKAIKIRVKSSVNLMPCCKTHNNVLLVLIISSEQMKDLFKQYEVTIKVTLKIHQKEIIR